jgi:hypothetical protein
MTIDTRRIAVAEIVRGRSRSPDRGVEASILFAGDGGVCPGARNPRAIVATMRVFLVVSILTLASPTPAARAEDGFHAGLNLRADNGAHPIRLIAGFDSEAVDVSLTLDPMVITDGQFDTDLLATARISEHGWGVIVGWRNTSIGILGGREYQEKLVLGIGAPLPLFGDLSVRTRWGFEAATVILKHGADLPPDWISFEQGRDFIDLINFGMYVTFECCHAVR